MTNCKKVRVHKRSTRTDGVQRFQFMLTSRSLELFLKLQFHIVSPQGNMNYKELMAGLINEGEAIQALHNFSSFMNYTYLQFCDERGNIVSQRSAGKCLLTNKRLLFLSLQLTAGKFM